MLTNFEFWSCMDDQNFKYMETFSVEIFFEFSNITVKIFGDITSIKFKCRVSTKLVEDFNANLNFTILFTNLNLELSAHVTS